MQYNCCKTKYYQKESFFTAFSNSAFVFFGPIQQEGSVWICGSIISLIRSKGKNVNKQIDLLFRLAQRPTSRRDRDPFFHGPRSTFFCSLAGNDQRKGERLKSHLVGTGIVCSGNKWRRSSLSNVGRADNSKIIVYYYLMHTLKITWLIDYTIDLVTNK